MAEVKRELSTWALTGWGEGEVEEEVMGRGIGLAGISSPKHCRYGRRVRKAGVLVEAGVRAASRKGAAPRGARTAGRGLEQEGDGREEMAPGS